METLRAFGCAVLGTLLGLVLGILCGSAIGITMMPQHPTNYDGVGGALWMVLGAGLGAFAGFIVGLCFPSWQHNLRRKKKLQALRQQRSLRAFTPADDTWPPPPKGQAVAGTIAITE